MIFVLGITVIAVGAAWFVLAEPRDPAGTERLARRVGLRLDRRVAESVVERLGARRWWAALGTAVGALVGGGLAWWLHGRGIGLEDRMVLVVIGGVVLGRSAGSVVAAWRERAQHLDPTAPRVARATTPRVADYVSPLERWGGWASVAVAFGVAVGLAFVSRVGALEVGRPPAALLVATVVLPAAAMGAFELVAVRLVARAQLARSPLDLAWDDVLRAELLRELVSEAIFVALMLSLLTVSVAGERTAGGWPENPGVGVLNGVFFAVLGVTVLAGVVGLVVKPQQHVMRRLWREVPA